MADDKIFTINTQKSMVDCENAFKSKDIVRAFSIYNDLDIEDQRMLLPQVASFYASVMNAYYEYGCLMRMIAYPKSHRVDPLTILSRISKFMVPLAGENYLDYYQKLVEKNFGVKFDIPLSPKKLIDMLTEKQNEKKKPFKLIFGDDGGEYYYKQAIECMSCGDTSGAKANLKQIKKEDSFYLDAQKYLAFILQTEGHPADAIKFLKRVIKENPNDKEALKRIESIVRDYNELADEVQDFLLSQKFSEDNTEANILIAKILMDKKEWHKAIESLEKVKDINMYSEFYLKLLSDAYLEVGEIEKCKNTLKSVMIIYPKNVRARYRLKSLELGKSKGVNNDGDYSEVKQMTIEANNFLEKTTEEDFRKLNLTELVYYFRTICYYGNDLNFKKACLIMLSVPKMREVLLDSLLEIETNEKQKEIIFSTLVQLKLVDKVNVLIFGKLKTVLVKYPKNLFNDKYTKELIKNTNVVRGKDASWQLYVANAYSQALTVRVFDEGKLSSFHKNAEIVVDGLSKLSEEQKMLFGNLDNLVFAMCLADDEKYLFRKTSFVSINQSVRQTIHLYIHMFKGDYDNLKDELGDNIEKNINNIIDNKIDNNTDNDND